MLVAISILIFILLLSWYIQLMEKTAKITRPVLRCFLYTMITLIFSGVAIIGLIIVFLAKGSAAPKQ